MRDKAIRSFLVFAGLLALSVPLLAHHGNAQYKDEKIILKGTVTEWSWINPHVFLKMDVKGDDGKIRQLDLRVGCAIQHDQLWLRED